MGPQPESAPPPAAGPGPSRPVPSSGVYTLPRPRRTPGRRASLALAGLVLLHVSHPLTWGRDDPILWFAPAGVGIALVAWLGFRAALLVAGDALLVVVQAWLVGEALGRPLDAGRVVGHFVDVVLLGAEVAAAWWCYHDLAAGTRRLGDPRSATLFLLLVAGLVAALFAVAQGLVAVLAEPSVAAWFEWFLRYWLSRALGILALAPLLLIALTPLLVRHGMVEAEPRGEQRGYEAVGQLAWPEWIEIAGLTWATAVLGVLLALGFDPRQLAGWQLWGVPVLLIVWASMRHGLWGGVLVASTAALLALVLATFRLADTVHPLLQGNLLAQLTTALLVGSSASFLRANEARYRQVVGHIPAVLYSARVVQPGARPGLPPRAEITFVSAACRKLLHCAPEDLLGDYELWLRQVHPQDRELVLAALAQLTRQDRPVVCEYRLHPALGTTEAAAPVSSRDTAGEVTVYSHRTPARERWVRDVLAQQVDAGGQLEGWEGIVTDISEQRYLTDDWRRTTKLFHALVANLPAGVFFVQGSTGRPILVNTRARKLLGQREDPAAGLHVFSQTYRLFRPDGTPYPTEDLPVSVALRRGTTTMRDDIVVHRPDGRRVPLVAWAAPIHLADPTQPDAAVWVFEDLTVLRQAETGRRESESRLRTVIDTMDTGLVVQDQSGKVIECNPAACALLGVPADQLRSRLLDDPTRRYVREDGSPLPADEHPAAVSLRTGQPVRNVILGLPQVEGAAPRWLLVSSVPLAFGRDPRPARVVTTLIDFTAPRRLPAD